MAKCITKTLTVLICFVLILQLIGCGTIMHPERKGQTGGRIDPGVAVLVAIGLLFFIIPGVIAFAVDFSNGTIYLPGTASSSLDMNDIKQVKFDPENTSLTDIERTIKEQTGYDVKLDRDNVRISRLRSTDDMMLRFAEALPEIRGARTVLSMK